ncbi:MurR/RpiR family transcriptional regulator [uncultured Jannaschia sp.]|uniref:MurR/RpiR family transcriptional regulator n=1 Tax=uncultured Jannaschia sp. TaxID=293347 RepID=UPI002628324D|nr:MurR/RpiR family transcriptional regulator [uncultured Jannaschia sp.]
MTDRPTEPPAGTQTDRPLVRDLLEERRGDLTAAERKLAEVLTEDSLLSGLQSITRVAEIAAVSTPTVIRLARKLGFDGFPALQDAIRADLAARMQQPLAKLEAAPEAGHGAHVVTRFAQGAARNIDRTLRRLDVAAFDAIAQDLAAPGRAVHLAGGRITRSLAQYLADHLRLIRADVRLLEPAPALWPQAVLDMGDASTLVLFDIRRYDREIETLARHAAGRGTRVVLLTDIWGSPVERHAAQTLRASVEAQSSWDSTVALLLLAEALVAEVQRLAPGPSAARLDALEGLAGATPMFRPR